MDWHMLSHHINCMACDFMFYGQSDTQPSKIYCIPMLKSEHMTEVLKLPILDI